MQRIINYFKNKRIQKQLHIKRSEYIKKQIIESLLGNAPYGAYNPSDLDTWLNGISMAIRQRLNENPSVANYSAFQFVLDGNMIEVAVVSENGDSPSSLHRKYKLMHEKSEANLKFMREIYDKSDNDRRKSNIELQDLVDGLSMFREQNDSLHDENASLSKKNLELVEQNNELSQALHKSNNELMGLIHSKDLDNNKA